MWKNKKNLLMLIWIVVAALYSLSLFRHQANFAGLYPDVAWRANQAIATQKMSPLHTPSHGMKFFSAGIHIKYLAAYFDFIEKPSVTALRNASSILAVTGIALFIVIILCFYPYWNALSLAPFILGSYLLNFYLKINLDCNAPQVLLFILVLGFHLAKMVSNSGSRVLSYLVFYLCFWGSIDHIRFIIVPISFLLSIFYTYALNPMYSSSRNQMYRLYMSVIIFSFACSVIKALFVEFYVIRGELFTLLLFFAPGFFFSFVEKNSDHYLVRRFVEKVVYVFSVLYFYKIIFFLLCSFLLFHLFGFSLTISNIAVFSEILSASFSFATVLLAMFPFVVFALIPVYQFLYKFDGYDDVGRFLIAQYVFVLAMTTVATRLVVPRYYIIPFLSLLVAYLPILKNSLSIRLRIAFFTLGLIYLSFSVCYVESHYSLDRKTTPKLFERLGVSLTSAYHSHYDELFDYAKRKKFCLVAPTYTEQQVVAFYTDALEALDKCKPGMPIFFFDHCYSGDCTVSGFNITKEILPIN